MKVGTIETKLVVRLSLWSAIKLRIAGFGRYKRERDKITIQELIDRERNS